MRIILSCPTNRMNSADTKVFIGGQMLGQMCDANVKSSYGVEVWCCYYWMYGAVVVVVIIVIRGRMCDANVEGS